MKYLIFIAFLLATANAFPFHVYKRDEHLVRLYKRATTFSKCPEGSPVTLTVTTTPDPTIGGDYNFTIMFITDKTYAKLFLTTEYVESDTGKIVTPGGVTTADLCAQGTGITCPVQQGKQVTISSKSTVPPATKAPYDIIFNVNDGNFTIGCSAANITGGATPSGGATSTGGPKGGATSTGGPKGGATPNGGPTPKGGAGPSPGPSPGPSGSPGPNGPNGPNGSPGPTDNGGTPTDNGGNGPSPGPTDNGAPTDNGGNGPSPGPTDNGGTPTDNGGNGPSPGPTDNGGTSTDTGGPTPS